MNKRNKLTILFAVITLLVIVYTICCVFYSKYISPVYILIGIISLELFYAVPKFNDLYYKLYGEVLGTKGKLLSAIPFYGYTVVMRKVFAIATLILLLVQSILVILAVCPSVMQIIFSTNDLLIAGDIYTTYLMIFFTLFNLVIGIGLYFPINDVNLLYKKSFPTKKAKGFVSSIKFILDCVPSLSIVLLSLPIFRVVVLLFCIEKAQTLIETSIN